MKPNHIDFELYQLLAMRTAKPMELQDDLLHAALGLTGEAGEFADCIKKHFVYGRDLDRVNAVEEVGDILWFCALACQTLGVSMADVAQQNIDKLLLRFPEKYTAHHAALRLDKHDETPTT